MVIGQTARFSGSEDVCVEGELVAMFLAATSGRRTLSGDDILRTWADSDASTR